MKLLKHLVLAVALSLLVSAAGVVSAPAAYVVSNTNDSGPDSLRNTIASAPAGTTITFAPNLSGATILLTNGQLLLNKNLTIDASALTNSIQINGSHASRIFEVASNKTVLLISLTITNGSGGTNGGGVYNRGRLTLSHCTIVGNSIPYRAFGVGGGGGGGIFNEHGTVTVNESAIMGNTAGDDGGGIYNFHGTLTVNQSTVADNSAPGDGVLFGFGGGIYINYGSVTVNQSTITGNSASLQGGGVLNFFATLTVNQSTIAGNWSPFAGGIENHGTLTLANSIVAENSVWDIYNGESFTRFGANIVPVFVAGSESDSSGPQATYVAPLLAPLGNHGGATPTMPPLPGSPAIDGCTNSTGFATDQRGFPRVVGTYADIGAVEGVFNPAGPGKLNVVRSSGNGSLKLAFTNSTDMTFTVLASPDVTLPLSAWTNLGAAVESPARSGQYQFTDPQTTNNSWRFYRVRTP